MYSHHSFCSQVSLFVSLELMSWWILIWSRLSQKKYKEDGKRKASISLYSQLPDTPEIQHALEVSQLQSEVHEQGRGSQRGSWEMWFKALSVTLSLSQVNYRPKMLVKGAPSSLYSQLPDTTDIQFAREMTEMQSEVQNTVWTTECVQSPVRGTGSNLRLAPIRL